MGETKQLRLKTERIIFMMIKLIYRILMQDC